MKESKKTNIAIAAIIFAIVLSGLMIFVLSNKTSYSNDSESSDYDNNVKEDTSKVLIDATTNEIKSYTEVNYEVDSDYDLTNATYVNLDDLSKSTYEITSGGTYVLSGTYEGQIVINSEDEETVKIILNGIYISSSENSPIYVENAKEVSIVLAEGTSNYITDTSSYIDPDVDESATPAAIYSTDDLYISGTGELTIISENKNGIQSKDQIVIIDGEITISAAKEAIKAKDYIVIQDGNLDLTSGEDGISITEEDDAEKGYIVIDGGEINIDSQYDGITAKTYIIINSGEIDITTSTLDTSKSAKGIKAGYYLEINGGTITIDSVDDGLHSNNKIVINSGTITISSGDDGIHADEAIEINGGEINIEKSYEGIEAAEIIINEGTIDITASDDGINSPQGKMTINGGTITIAAAGSGAGDGLDSNGDITIAGGNIVIIMPSSYRDYSSIDYDRTFSLTGGQVRILNTDGTYTEVTESNVGSVSGMIGGGMTPGTNTQMPTGGATRPRMR